VAAWLKVARRWTVPAAVLALAVLVPGVASAADQATAPGPVISPITEFSHCSGQNNEIEQAAAHGYVYEEWIGCGNRIGFATSTDGGRHFGKPVVLPGSGGGWDPALAVAPNGTVYAAFMSANTSHSYQVVVTLVNHGKAIKHVSMLIPTRKGNWGDRDFIAVSPAGVVYVTWDYGPSANKVKFICSPAGSCGFSAGDVNVVVQKSTDGGLTWGRIVHISPGFPASGADSAPLLVAPDGKIYVDYQGYRVTNGAKLTLSSGHSFFTASANGGATWSKPVRIGPAGLTMNTSEWWIDGDMSTDSVGTLFATWDSQVRGRDIGWLAYSTNHGRAGPGIQSASRQTPITRPTSSRWQEGRQASPTSAGWPTIRRAATRSTCESSRSRRDGCRRSSGCRGSTATSQSGRATPSASRPSQSSRPGRRLACSPSWSAGAARRIRSRRTGPPS
jgi:hypothetical protein